MNIQLYKALIRRDNKNIEVFVKGSDSEARAEIKRRFPGAWLISLRKYKAARIG